MQFYEYFHGDDGAGLGASHQTGWTGVIARLLHFFATASSEKVLDVGARAALLKPERPAKRAPAVREPDAGERRGLN